MQVNEIENERIGEMDGREERLRDTMKGSCLIHGFGFDLEF